MLSYARLALVPCISMLNGSLAQEAGFDDTDRAIRVSERHDGLVLSTWRSGEWAYGGAHRGREGTEEQLGEVDGMAAEITERTADGSLSGRRSGPAASRRSPHRETAEIRL